ncbi:cation diffusion facilitator family transporter [Auraticoccus monumenti]|uniref:Cobalt-zinc-cadmium efflux system protein n=1 Tax=Auraticoccus monumenti TaxID=675864 RepID=A0A1G6YKN5_9ACTN|nr:cation diffusion facilitator family transporter [Auraticoccus monumenti]SDD90890.1 cobalt-zinc-cadmium efflux system protein [Auraticoccus monumenti]
MSGHSHAHAPTATGRHRRRLVIALVLTASVFLVQLVGGLASGSLALLADAGHVLIDSTGLLVALVAAGLATRPATAARTFGLQRVEVLAALVNGLLLVGIAVWVLVRAVDRWDEPVQISTPVMLGAAVVGGLANLAALLVLRGAKDESLNLRGAYLEVLGDLLGSAAVVVAAVVIALTGFTRADTLASLAIVALVVPRAWSLLREVVDVLLEATPRGVDLAEVRRHIREVPGVVDVHDLHAWTITSGVPVLSAHVVVDAECIEDGRTGVVLDRLGECLGEDFDIEHCTFQLEPVGHRAHESVHHA